MPDTQSRGRKFIDKVKRKESIFVLGMAAGSVATIVVLKQNPVVMTMTAEQAERMLNDPTMAIVAKTLTRTFAAQVVPA